MNGKNKIFKNPNRTESLKYQPYVPQYKLLDLDPIPINMPNHNVNSFVTRTGPKEKFVPSIISPKNQSTKIVESSNGDINSKFPNIGQNSNMTWSSLDNIYVDEHGNQFELTSNNEIIDNSYTEEKNNNLKKQNSSDEYLLFINDNLISTGSLVSIEEEVKQLVFNEHKSYQDVEVESISVFKKIEIKVGIFLKG